MTVHTYHMKNFMKCGICGWCLELIWTSLHSLSRRDYKLIGHSSIWMFPIYGMASFIRPLSQTLKHKNTAVRGLIYMNGIFSIEYLTGILLKKKDLCPWDYSDVPLNCHGVIRLDYAPVWFVTGLFFEKFLKP